VGIARVGPISDRDAAAYRAWLAAGQHGEMHYLAQQVEARLDSRQKWPWARSAIVVALSYYQEDPNANSPAPSPASGRIARYAWGRDYHRVLDVRLRRLEKTLRQHLPEPFEARACCDTAPVLERELAARAGLGWTGKHTLLIHPRHGSWFVLGELITSLDLAVDEPIPDHCGTCRRCIDACPTQAITPWQVDGQRCLSDLTLEHRSAIPAPLQPLMAGAGYVAGCDICQEVCPFNRQPLPLSDPDFHVQAPAPRVPLDVVQGWTELDWDVATRGRAHRRARFAMWQRNAAILAQRPTFLGTGSLNPLPNPGGAGDATDCPPAPSDQGNTP